MTDQHPSSTHPYSSEENDGQNQRDSHLKPHPVKWKDLLLMEPEQSLNGRTIHAGDSYTFPAPSLIRSSFTSPHIHLCSFRTKPGPGEQHGFVRHIWWFSYHPDGVDRPGEIQCFLDIIPLEPLGDLKGCRDNMVDVIHPEGVLGLMMDKIEGVKEGLEEEIPSLIDQDRMYSYIGQKKAEIFDVHQYEWTRYTSASDRLIPGAGLYRFVRFEGKEVEKIDISGMTRSSWILPFPFTRNDQLALSTYHPIEMSKLTLSHFLRPLRPLTQPGRRAYATSKPSASASLNIPSTQGGPQAPLEYCSSLVQRLDPEAWLCSYFWPRRERSWYLAYRAFNLELHLISTTVTQPALAAIRFQFWRDALKIIFSTNSETALKVPQHPVALLLADLKRNRPVQRYYLSQMIETRAKILSLPPSSPTLESHLFTHTPLSTSLLLGPLPILLPPADPASSHISHTLSHLSTLLTTVSLLRNLPVLVSSKRQINFPSDICEKHNIVEEEVLRKGAEARGFRDAALEIGTRGMDELITARRDLKDTGGKVKPDRAMPIFLSAVPAENYLQRLENLDFDVFHPDLQKHDWKLAPKIWWRFQSGKL